MNFFRKVIRELFRRQITKRYIDSRSYWEDRYYYGGNSGKGSYAKDAIQKANFLNDTILNYRLKNIIDVGCGDGNNLKLFKSDFYIGIDVSKTIVDILPIVFSLLLMWESSSIRVLIVKDMKLLL